MAFPHDYHRAVMADFLDAVDGGRRRASPARGAQGAPPDRRAAGRRHDRPPVRRWCVDKPRALRLPCRVRKPRSPMRLRVVVANSREKLNATQSQGQAGRRRRRQQGHRALDRARIRATPAPPSRSARAAGPALDATAAEIAALGGQGACRRMRPRRQGRDCHLHRGGRGFARRHRYSRQQRLRASAPPTTRRAGPRASTST